MLAVYNAMNTQSRLTPLGSIILGPRGPALPFLKLGLSFSAFDESVTPDLSNRLMYVTE